MSDIKRRKLAGGGAAVDSSATDMICHAFGHFLQKCCQFLRFPFRDQLNPPVGQVANEPGHLKFPGDTGSGVPKTDPLHMPGIENLATLASGAGHLALFHADDG